MDTKGLANVSLLSPLRDLAEPYLYSTVSQQIKLPALLRTLASITTLAQHVKHIALSDSAPSMDMSILYKATPDDVRLVEREAYLAIVTAKNFAESGTTDSF